MLACALAATVAVAPLAGCSAQGGSSTSLASAASSEDLGDEQYILYHGTNDRDTNKPVYSREESKERAKAILMKNFGGYTIQEAEGGWKSDDGTEYQEYTLVIYLSDTDLNAVHKASRELINEFHQSSVLISTERVKTEFYAGE